MNYSSICGGLSGFLAAAAAAQDHMTSSGSRCRFSSLKVQIRDNAGIFGSAAQFRVSARSSKFYFQYLVPKFLLLSHAFIHHISRWVCFASFKCHPLITSVVFSQGKSANLAASSLLLGRIVCGGLAWVTGSFAVTLTEENIVWSFTFLTKQEVLPSVWSTFQQLVLEVCSCGSSEFLLSAGMKDNNMVIYSMKCRRTNKTTWNSVGFLFSPPAEAFVFLFIYTPSHV